MYKLNSVLLNHANKEILISRETYSALEWISDIGGLYDGLKIIASTLILPVPTLAMNSLLLT